MTLKIHGLRRMSFGFLRESVNFSSVCSHVSAEFYIRDKFRPKSEVFLWNFGVPLKYRANFVTKSDLREAGIKNQKKCPTHCLNGT